MSDNNKSSGGIGFGGLLFIVFLILKLTHTIEWSWVWVTAPLWIPVGLLFAALIVLGVFIIGIAVLEAILK